MSNVKVNNIIMALAEKDSISVYIVQYTHIAYITIV